MCSYEERRKAWKLRDGRHLRALKAFAAERGDRGGVGGWIYARGGQHICQGWFSYLQMERTPFRDWLTRKFTASERFSDLLNTKGNYRPTLLYLRPRDWMVSVLADEYDQAQAERKDPRRAYRGHAAAGEETGR